MNTIHNLKYIDRHLTHSSRLSFHESNAEIKSTIERSRNREHNGIYDVEKSILSHTHVFRYVHNV